MEKAFIINKSSKYCKSTDQMLLEYCTFTFIEHFDDCMKDVFKERYVQEEEMSDSDEESAEVEDK